MTQPNLLIIGAARSATTAVAAALAQRPEVFITSPKETHFWAFAGRKRQFTGPGDEEMINRSLVTEPSEYHQLYRNAGAATLRGDGSVSTLYHPAAAVENIRAHAAPDAKLVCLLREPAARAHSAFLYLRSRGYEHHTSFADGLAAEAERTEAGFHHMWHYTAMSRYGAQLPAFAEAFGDRLFVGVAEEVQRDPARFGEQLCEFLGISSTPGLSLDVSVNRGGEPRSAVVAQAMRLARSAEPVRKAVLTLVPASVRERIRRANLAEGPAADLAALRSTFVEDVAAVEEVLGRRIEAWHA